MTNLGEMTRELAALKVQKNKLEDTLKQVNAEIEALSGQMVDKMIEEGVHSQKTNWGTSYLHNQIWASAPDLEDGSGKDYGRLKYALIAAGYPELVTETVNTQRLSALIREFPTDNEGNPILPKPLVGNVKISPKIEVRIRGANIGE